MGILNASKAQSKLLTKVLLARQAMVALSVQYGRSGYAHTSVVTPVSTTVALMVTGSNALLDPLDDGVEVVAREARVEHLVVGHAVGRTGTPKRTCTRR